MEDWIKIDDRLPDFEEYENYVRECVCTSNVLFSINGEVWMGFIESPISNHEVLTGNTVDDCPEYDIIINETTLKKEDMTVYLYDKINETGRGYCTKKLKLTEQYSWNKIDGWMESPKPIKTKR